MFGGHFNNTISCCTEYSSSFRGKIYLDPGHINDKKLEEIFFSCRFNTCSVRSDMVECGLMLSCCMG